MIIYAELFMVRTGGGVSVAEALAADGDVLDRVEKSPVEGSILVILLLGVHQVGVERANLLQSQPHVTRRREVEQFGRCRQSSRTTVDQRRVNLNHFIQLFI